MKHLKKYESKKDNNFNLMLKYLNNLWLKHVLSNDEFIIYRINESSKFNSIEYRIQIQGTENILKLYDFLTNLKEDFKIIESEIIGGGSNWHSELTFCFEFDIDVINNSPILHASKFGLM
jgi:hypothetical protein